MPRVTLPEGQVRLIDRAQVDFWPKDNDIREDEPAWSRIRMSMADRSGTYAAQWWSAFSDEGLSAKTSTEFLVPDGGSVNLGHIVLDAGTAVFGELMKTDGSGSAPLEPADIVNPCTEVLWVVEGNNTQFVNAVCGFDGNPALGSDQAGKWRLGLAPGNYVFRFVDRANSFGVDNLLNYNVRFAPEWWRNDGTRAERRDDADIVTVTEQDTEIELGARVLRDAHQMRVEITDIPESVTNRFDQSIGRDELIGQIRVGDQFGNWTGGAMTIDSAEGTADAAVTGLVPGTDYRIYVTFNGPEYQKWWLVGGGTLDEATPLTSAAPFDDGDATALITESWPASPIFVTVYDQFGVPYGTGDACVALVADGESEPAARACVTDRFGLPSIVVLQRVPDGVYRVAVYRPGGPAIRLDDLIVDDQLETVTYDAEYSIGVSDVSRLEPGWPTPFGFEAKQAVVLPDPTRPEPPLRDLLLSLHDEQGAPYADGSACIRLLDSDSTIATEGCATTVEFGGDLPGSVIMSSQPAGVYGVEAFRADGDGQPDGTLFELEPFEVRVDLPSPEGLPWLAFGPADTSRRADGVTIENPPYSNAVVVPSGSTNEEN